MALLGPDGNPMAGGRIIGGPKSIDDLPLFDILTIDEMVKGMNQLLGQGQPPELPAGVPLGNLAQMARTMKHYHDRSVEQDELLRRLFGEVKTYLFEANIELHDVVEARLSGPK
jgi:hypothetical protein